jgi:hypothetical protein
MQTIRGLKISVEMAMSSEHPQVVHPDIIHQNRKVFELNQKGQE